MIYITRPSPQGEALLTLCQKQFIPAQFTPLFKFHSTGQESQLKSILNQLKSGDSLIFTSPQLIPILKQADISFPDFLRFYTVGKGTATKLMQHFPIQVEYPTESEDSEGLIKLFQLQQRDFSKQTTVLLKGNVGRTVLKEYIKSEKGTLIEWIGYERHPIDYLNSPIKTSHLNSGSDAIIVTSLEHLKQLERWVDVSIKKAVTLILTHPRFIEPAKSLGWDQLYLAENATNECLIDILKENKWQ